MEHSKIIKGTVAISTDKYTEVTVRLLNNFKKLKVSSAG